MRQENYNSPKHKTSVPQFNGIKHDGKFYASIAGLAIILIVLTALFIPQGSGSTLELSLNYKPGEHMVYDTTNIVTNQISNSSLGLPDATNTQSYNSTLTLDIIGSDLDNYIVNETIVTAPNLFGRPLPPLTINVSKASYSDNFIPPGGPLIFYNANNNPIISSYLAQSSVKVGDVWRIPVNTGNASLGLTGEVTLTFAALQNLTVPAGTFDVIRIEITSNDLRLHSDGSSSIKIPHGMTLQLNGSSYIEQGTCRLIKADLLQLTTANTPGIGSTSTMYTEKTLVEYTKH